MSVFHTKTHPATAYINTLLIAILTTILPFAHRSIHARTPSTARLQADELTFQQAAHKITTSGNVQLRLNDTLIQTDTLYIDTQQNIAWSSGNIKIHPNIQDNTRQNDYFFSDKILINLDSQQLYLYNLDLKIKPLDSSQDLFLKSQELSQNGTVMKGKKGVITSCALPDPHYYIRASHYSLTPDHHIIGTNVFFYIPIWKLPFGLYSPIYVYQIGDRQLIWNFPTIGKKSTPGWGWFAQNTIDYARKNGEDSSIFFDVFTQDDFNFHEKAWGTGIRHQYSLFDQPGSLYYYTLNVIDEPDVNQKKEWTQQLTLSDTLKAKLHYSDINAIRINASGRTQTQKKYIELHHNDLGDRQTFRFNESQNFLSTAKSTQATYARDYESDHHKLNIDHTENESARLKTTRTNTRTQTILPGQITLQEELNFVEKSNEQIEYVQYLDSRFTLSKKFNRTTAKFQYNQLIDTRAGTANIPENVQNEAAQNYNYFYKMPELTLSHHNPDFGPFSFQSDTIIARYKEVQFRANNDTAPQNETLEPNTYIFKNAISQTWTTPTTNTSFSFNMGYDQYLFKNDGASLFESDALYFVYITPKLTTHIAPFIKTETQFNWKGIGDGSNSPFIQFQNLARGETNLLTQSLVFYDPIQNRINWTHSAGYNYITDKWTTYITSLQLKPVNAFETHLSTSRDLENGRWNLLNTQTTLRHGRNTLNQSLNRDIQNGEIRYSNINTRFFLGNNKDYEWSFQLNFSYDTATGQNRTLQLDKYQLDEYGFVKTDHCRTYTFSYNKTLDQWRFKYTILAYPKDSFGIRKDKDVTQFEGLFDEKSQERF